MKFLQKYDRLANISGYNFMKTFGELSPGLKASTRLRLSLWLLIIYSRSKKQLSFMKLSSLTWINILDQYKVKICDTSNSIEGSSSHNFINQQTRGVFSNYCSYFKQSCVTALIYINRENKPPIVKFVAIVTGVSLLYRNCELASPLYICKPIASIHKLLRQY